MLPDLDDAVSLAAGTAAVMSESARLPFARWANDELDADSRLGDDEWPQPASMTHTIAGSLVLAAGDFVHGMHAVIQPGLNLAFSSATLARSACEYAARACWLLDAEIGVDHRIARALALIRDSIKKDEPLFKILGVTDPSPVPDAIDRWAHRHSITVRRGPPPTPVLIEAVVPGGGITYRQLHALVHGGVRVLLRTTQLAIDDSVERRADIWDWTLIATITGLTAAHRISESRTGRPAQLDNMVAWHNALASSLQAWDEKHGSSSDH
jgi:hypothetical protein